MKPFRYLRDPLFLLCCALYCLNRFAIKPWLPVTFFHSWFNDTLLIPCALPPLLWLHRRLGLRATDSAPSVGEVLCHLAGWSILFEVIGPRLMPRCVGDPWDVVAYCAGAAVAYCWWRVTERSAFELGRKLPA